MSKPERFLDVIDTSASSEYPIRKHDMMVDGEIHTVEFHYGKATTLPYALGARFLQDGFKVSDHDGNPVTAPAAGNDVINNLLGEDEVVANYSELSIEALQVRALSRVGGELFLGDDIDRAEIVTFLKTAAVDDAEEAPEPEVEEELDEDGETEVGNLTPKFDEEDEDEVDVGGQPQAPVPPPAEPVVSPVVEPVTAPVDVVAGEDSGIKAETPVDDANAAHVAAAEAAAAPAKIDNLSDLEARLNDKAETETQPDAEKKE